MPSKCVETIDRLPHEGKDIVRSSGKPETRVHNRDRHGFGHPSEPAASDRRSRDYNRGCDVSRAEGLDPAQSGMASKSGGSGGNIFGASFSIRGMTG